MRAKSLLFALGVSLSIARQGQAQNITPEPIGLPSAQFTAPSSVLDAAVAAGDTNTLRQHAWTLWSGVTADSTQNFQGKVLPIWETWLSEQEVFAPPADRRGGATPQGIASFDATATV